MAEPGEGVDLSALNADLAEAQRALEVFANGPAKAAGESLEAAFAKAGNAIRGELEQLAKSGEADLDRLGRAVLETLAKLAVDRVFGGGGVAREASAPVNVTMNFSGGASGERAVGSSNQVAAAVARAVRRGVRFS
jgi:hypothetical protein